MLLWLLGSENPFTCGSVGYSWTFWDVRDAYLLLCGLSVNRCRHWIRFLRVSLFHVYARSTTSFPFIYYSTLFGASLFIYSFFFCLCSFIASSEYGYVFSSSLFFLWLRLQYIWSVLFGISYRMRFVLHSHD